MTEAESTFDRLDVQITYRGKVYRNHIVILRELHDQHLPNVRHQALTMALDKAVRPVVDQVIDDHTEKWLLVRSRDDGGPADLLEVPPPAGL